MALKWKWYYFELYSKNHRWSVALTSYGWHVGCPWVAVGYCWATFRRHGFFLSLGRMPVIEEGGHIYRWNYGVSF